MESINTGMFGLTYSTQEDTRKKPNIGQKQDRMELSNKFNNQQQQIFDLNSFFETQEEVFEFYKSPAINSTTVFLEILNFLFLFLAYRSQLKF